ncbi:MAG TPA: hypothetical protein VHZ78_12780 [Rhizomicrobium sp.]|jgi:hypothetical protein|nr:hypothetical protein [Rhizomicrobium sp.]
MRQPDFSNAAQQAQEQESAADVVRARKDIRKLQPRLKSGDGAVHGGEQTKPGQMSGDEDIAATAPQAAIERAVGHKA